MVVQKEGFICFCYRVLLKLRTDRIEVVDPVFMADGSSDF